MHYSRIARRIDGCAHSFDAGSPGFVAKSFTSRCHTFLITGLTLSPVAGRFGGTASLQKLFSSALVGGRAADQGGKEKFFSQVCNRV
jgi:hypothetical protein